MFILKIRTGNAAFYDSDGNLAPEMEIARILRAAADDVETYLDPDMTLRDHNGNACGSVRYR